MKAHSGKRCKALSFLSTRRYVGVDDRFSPRKRDPVPILQEAGWAPGVRKISTPVRFDPRTVQPVASCYINLKLYLIPTVYAS